MTVLDAPALDAVGPVDTSTALPRYSLEGPANAPVVAVLGGISATRNVVGTATRDGWWSEIAGAGRAIDTNRVRVLGLDFLDGGRDASGRPERIVTTRDQAAALRRVLQAEDTDRLSEIVGSSCGGMVGLAFAERFESLVDRLVVISAAHESHPMSTALRTLQRRIVELGLETDRRDQAMSIARGLAMTTYRTAGEFAARFASQATALSSNDASFEVDRYLRARGDAFAERMPAERFLALSLSGDLHSVDPSRITVPVTLVAAEGDAIVPIDQMQQLAGRLGGPVHFVHLPTRVGHDAFLVEVERVSSIVTNALTSNLC